MNLESVEPIFISVLLFVYVLIFCELARQVVQRTSEYDYDMQYLANEFFGTVQVCAMMFETGRVAMFYGENAYIITLFLVIFLHFLTLRTAYVNPVPMIELWNIGYISSSGLVAHLGLQIGGASFSFQLTRVFWNFRLRPDHASLAENYVCYSPLKVDPITGMVAECFGAFFLRVGVQKLIEMFPKVYPLLVAMYWATLVKIGVTLTGFYLNPILAMSQTYGCIGLTIWQEMAVYWFAPMLGSYSGSKFYWKKIYSPPKMPPPDAGGVCEPLLDVIQSTYPPLDNGGVCEPLLDVIQSTNPPLMPPPDAGGVCEPLLDVIQSTYPPLDNSVPNHN